MARPKKYEQGAERITLSLSPETKVVVEAFCRWYSFTRDKTLGIGAVSYTHLTLPTSDLV